jgi:hypothetical protein
MLSISGSALAGGLSDAIAKAVPPLQQQGIGIFLRCAGEADAVEVRD